MAQTGVSLKLLIDKKKDKVLFAEADKDFVDFLFYIMALPIGTVIGLLKEQGMEGGLQNLYKSIENLSQTYLQPDLNKDTLLKPKVSISGAEVPLLLSNVVEPPSTEGIKGGYVKGVVTYMVMDNLEVKPMSTISSITLLNKFNITEIGTLEEKVLDFGIEEGMKLLKASLQSKTVLTDVFLSKLSESPVSISTKVGTTESINEGGEGSK